MARIRKWLLFSLFADKVKANGYALFEGVQIIGVPGINFLFQEKGLVPDLAKLFADAGGEDPEWWIDKDRELSKSIFNEPGYDKST